MLEHPHMGTTKSDTKANRGVIQLVRNDEASLAHECGDIGRIGGKTHGGNERILHAHETCNESFADSVQVARTTLESRSESRHTITFDGLLDSVCASTASLRESEVIIGRDVEGASFRSCEDLGVVVIGGDTVEEENSAASNSSDGLRKALIHSGFKPSGIE